MRKTQQVQRTNHTHFAAPNIINCTFDFPGNISISGLIYEGSTKEKALREVANQNGVKILSLYYPEYNQHEILGFLFSDGSCIASGNPKKIERGDFSVFNESEMARKTFLEAANKNPGFEIHFFVGPDGIPFATNSSGEISQILNLSQIKATVTTNSFTVRLVSDPFDPKTISDFQKKYESNGGIKMDEQTRRIFAAAHSADSESKQSDNVFMISASSGMITFMETEIPLIQIPPPKPIPIPDFEIPSSVVFPITHVHYFLTLKTEIVKEVEMKSSSVIQNIVANKPVEIQPKIEMDIAKEPIKNLNEKIHIEPRYIDKQKIIKPKKIKKSNEQRVVKSQINEELQTNAPIQFQPFVQSVPITKIRKTTDKFTKKLPTHIEKIIDLENSVIITPIRKEKIRVVESKLVLEKERTETIDYKINLEKEVKKEESTKIRIKIIKTKIMEIVEKIKLKIKRIEFTKLIKIEIVKIKEKIVEIIKSITPKKIQIINNSISYINNRINYIFSKITNIASTVKSRLNVQKKILLYFLFQLLGLFEQKKKSHLIKRGRKFSAKKKTVA